MEKESLDKVQILCFAPGQISAYEGIADQGECRVTKSSCLKDPDGFHDGLVTSLDKASNSVMSLISQVFSQEAERSYSVVLANRLLRTFKYSSSQYYHDDRKAITSTEVQSVISQTRSVATIPLNEHILQAVPESFLVNDMDGVQNPLGLEASRLGVNLTLHTMSFQEFRNIQKCLEVCEAEIKGYYPKTITLPEAMLTQDEKQQGAVLIDLDEDAVQFTLFKNNALISSRTVDLGGNYVSSRISNAWNVENHDALRLKQQFGSLNIISQFKEELVPLIERSGAKKNLISKEEFQEVFIQIVYDWFVSLWTACDEFTQQHKVVFPHYILSGRAASLDGLVEFVQRRFSRVCRLGTVKKVDAPHELLMDPSCAAALGMFKWQGAHLKEHRDIYAPANIFQKTMASAKEWFLNYF